MAAPAPWRELWHRLQSVTTEEEAIEAIGDMRELFALEIVTGPARIPPHRAAEPPRGALGSARCANSIRSEQKMPVVFRNGGLRYFCFSNRLSA